MTLPIQHHQHQLQHQHPHQHQHHPHPPSASSSMMPHESIPRFGHDVLCMFDAAPESWDFLANIIESCRDSQEVAQLLNQSLLVGSEGWHHLIECAKSIQLARGINDTSLEGQDLLSHIWHIFRSLQPSSPPNLTEQTGWEETDRLIAQAKALERQAEEPTSSFAQAELPSDSEAWAQTDRLIALARTLEQHPASYPALFLEPTEHVDPDYSFGQFTEAQDCLTSHYWSEQTQPHRPKQISNWTRDPYSRKLVLSTLPHPDPARLAVPLEPSQGIPNSAPVNDQDASTRASQVSEDVVVARRTKISPYFASTVPVSAKTSPKKRPPAGTVSTVPFASLTAPTFGVIQEEFAHDPFWLLIAVTFLIRTNGKLAIPMFYKIKEQFPTPRHIADPGNTHELIETIRHLGLSVVRVAFMQKYARGFLENPPRAGRRYKVKNYERRDFDPSLRLTDETLVSDSPTPAEEGDDLDSWEIGHLTQGKYAIDSWRIFCRDELLGRAEDWNGEGREPEFQPEWMRVMPDDKELRAYLRWMWMREGWEWNPITGEKTALRDEMRRAVNEGRVEYDDTGGLRILEEPRAVIE